MRGAVRPEKAGNKYQQAIDSGERSPQVTGRVVLMLHTRRRVQEVEGFAVDLGDKVGVMRPMAHRPQCGSCHGRPDKFSTAIRAELKDRYPVDAAVGFEEGEIRGWYWVEVPKKRTR